MLPNLYNTEKTWNFEVESFEENEAGTSDLARENKVGTSSLIRVAHEEGSYEILVLFKNKNKSLKRK